QQGGAGHLRPQDPLRPGVLQHRAPPGRRGRPVHADRPGRLCRAAPPPSEPRRAPEGLDTAARTGLAGDGGIVMRDFFGRLFSREEGSKKAAKDRLRLVLVHDRTSLSPHLLDTLKEDLIQTISKYLEIDTEGLEVN